MPSQTFNTVPGRNIGRELMIAYLNTGTTNSPIWSPVGRRVQDSSSEWDWESDTIRDILGNVYGTLKKPKITQSFEPGDLDGGDDAQLKIWNLAVNRQDPQALAAQDMLIVHFYAADSTTATNFFAERYSACMVRPTSLGGEGGGDLAMPIDITYGGTRTTGHASRNASTGAVTFTADT